MYKFCSGPTPCSKLLHYYHSKFPTPPPQILARRSLDIGIELSPMRLLVRLSVDLSVWKVYCGKTAD